MFVMTDAEIVQTPWVDEFFRQGVTVRTLRRGAHEGRPVVTASGAPGAARAATRMNHSFKRTACVQGAWVAAQRHEDELFERALANVKVAR